MSDKIKCECGYNKFHLTLKGLICCDCKKEYFFDDNTSMNSINDCNKEIFNDLNKK